MHSSFEIPGIPHQQPPPPPPENSCPPLLLSMNPTQILDQIHALPTSTSQHHLPLDPHFPPHHYAAASSSSSAAYFPLNFKLGLNQIPSTNHFKNGAPPPDSLHYHMPFWEPIQAEASNENSEIIDQRESLTTCLDAKTRLHYSELDAIYKRDAAQTHPTTIQTLAPPPNVSPSPSKKEKLPKKKKKQATTTTTTSCEDDHLVAPMAEFFEDLVKQVMDHQESLQKKFAEVMDRLNEERRAREEAWRSQELAHFEREAAARAHDKAAAKSREALIVSYLEKITGQRINLAASEITATNTSDDSSEPPTTTYC